MPVHENTWESRFKKLENITPDFIGSPVHVGTQK